MNKKVLAVAVAGALALPGVALAQSSVTISGFFKGGFESLKYGDSAKSKASQTGIVDDSSRIIFNVREDLGGGLAAIGQIDMRFGLDSGALSAAGNTWVGLQSSQWGRLFVGRQDLHYFGRESNLTVRGSLRADSISILAYSAGGAFAVAPPTRTTNVVHYTTPNWGGFSAIVAYSANPFANEADINAVAPAAPRSDRKGSAWNIAPVFQGNNWTVGYSYWSAKPDAQVIAGVPLFVDKTRGDRLFGSYQWGGLKVGLAWDNSKWTGVGGLDAKRTAWSIPIEYSWGPHNIMFHYDKAKSDKGNIFTGLQTGAKMFALSYGYDLSKRTSAAITYASIKNERDATYGFFTSSALALGSAPPSVNAQVPGEDPKMWAVTLRHAF